MAIVKRMSLKYSWLNWEKLKISVQILQSKELSEVMGKIIMEQFEKHLNSVALESKKHPSIYKESLFIRTCDTIANTLSELGLKKDAQKVSDIANALI